MLQVQEFIHGHADDCDCDICEILDAYIYENDLPSRQARYAMTGSRARAQAIKHMEANNARAFDQFVWDAVMSTDDDKLLYALAPMKDMEVPDTAVTCPDVCTCLACRMRLKS